MPAEIGDYALIGDCETAALVSREGSMDWLCWPTFASPACFASLLGDSDNGHWSIAPAAEAKCKRRYRDHTLILETTFETKEGSATLVDFMPIRGKNSDVVRIVAGVRGAVQMRMELILRFDYGRAIPWITDLEEHGVRLISGPNLAILRTDAQLNLKN
jgi:GH15 family glucan-1,4-alpha-glucosidase